MGILTCHDVYNYGASLQAYALSTWLKEQRIEVNILHYKPDYLYRLLNFMEVDAPKWQSSALRRWAYRLRLLPCRLKLLPKYLRYKRFNRRRLPLTRCYRTEAQLQSLGGYDAFLCGSDQIWSSVNNACGEDPAFFLSFAGNTRKISYAASFGANRVSPAGEACVKKYLPGFHRISVRERSGVELLETLGIAARQVLDPVFLLPRQHWEAMAADPGNLPEEYILVYGYDNGVDMETLAGSLGCRVVSLGKNSPYSMFGPEEFIYMIAHARLVVTSSFHAVAFSLLLERPFVAMPTGKAALFERLNSILTLTGQTSRIWQPGMDLKTLRSPDFAASRQALARARQESEQFLQEALYDPEDI